MRCTAALTVLLAAAAVRAGDQPEHRQMVYALALAAGYGPGEAKVVADGSWSMDCNESTTAFRSLAADGKAALAECSRVIADPRFGARLLTEDRALDAVIFAPGAPLARIGPAAFNHALMTDPRSHGSDRNQPGMDAVYREYIRNQTARLHGAGLSAEDVRRTQLLLVGQYLHQAVDSFVHPRDALFGHALEGHTPDYTYAHVESYTQAANKVLTTLRTFRPEVPPAADRGSPLPFANSEAQLAFCHRLVEAAAAGYNLGRKVRPLGGFAEITSREEVQISEKVGNFLAGALGRSERVPIPRFDKVTYTAAGDHFDIVYEGKEADIDNVVPWVLSNPKYQDLAASVRANMRRHVKTWLVLDQAFRELGARLTDTDPPRFAGPTGPDTARRVLQRLAQAGEVDLDLALVFLSEVNVPGLVARPDVQELERAVAAARDALEKRGRWQALLDAAAAQIRANPAAFYRAHLADCTRRGTARPDGSFDFLYRPSLDWVRQRKEEARRLVEALAALETNVRLLADWVALLEPSRLEAKRAEMATLRAKYAAALDELRQR